MMCSGVGVKWWIFVFFRPLGTVTTTGVNSDTAKVCGIVFTSIMLMGRFHLATSGKRTTTTAGIGKNTEHRRPR